MKFNGSICLATCQRGLIYRLLHNVWVPLLFIIALGIMMIVTDDMSGIYLWLIISAFLTVIYLIRVIWLCFKYRRLVEKLRSMDIQELDLQIASAELWGNSVYLLDDHVFAPVYFFIVPYSEIERLRIKTWRRLGVIITDIQLIFYCGSKRYKTMLKDPQKFDRDRFENALQHQLIRHK